MEAQDEVAARAGAAAVCADCARVRSTLTWLEADGSIQPPVLGEPREAVATTAADLTAVCALVRSFLAAAAGFYGGPRRERLVYDRPVQRVGTLLYADLSGSREHAMQYGLSSNAQWKDVGLSLVAQWAKAFGGREMKDRQGDAIWLEFAEHGDPAPLCASAVQQHAHALRSLDMPSQWCGLYVAVDHGELIDGDMGNITGTPCDRIEELAKGRGKAEQALEDAVVSDDAAGQCSARLRGKLTPLTPTLAGLEAESNGHAAEGSLSQAGTLDAEATIREFCERIRATAAGIAADSEVPSAPRSASSSILIEDEVLDVIDPASSELRAPGS
jgi:class 3 adenylate cyclase